MNIIYYKYDYEYFNDLISLKTEVRSGKLSLYENILSRFFDTGVIDRTNTLPKSVKSKSIFPVPSKIEMTDTYEEIVKDAVTHMTKTDDMPYMLYYNGTIDDTVVVLAMIESSKDFTIKVKEDVYNEQKEFLDSLTVNVKLYESREYNNKDYKHNTMISGELGRVVNDCDYVVKLLKGSNGDFDELNDDGSYLEKYLETLLLTNSQEEPLKVQFNELKEMSGLESSYSILYYTAFNLAYQGLTFRNMTQSMALDIVRQNTKQFFGTDKFQRYAQINMEKVVTEENFKKDAKDYINSRTDKYNYNSDLVYGIQKYETQVRYITDELKQFRDMGIIAE